MQRVKDLFDIPEKETGCSFYDTDLMQNVSVNRTQISALSRDPRRRLSPKLMRDSYETSIEQAKTLYSLTHTVTAAQHHCKNCGYPGRAIRCVSTDVCKARREWVKFICSLYQIECSITKFQIIWELLLKNEISANETSLKMGLSLCQSKDVVKNQNIPQQWLTGT